MIHPTHTLRSSGTPDSDLKCMHCGATDESSKALALRCPSFIETAALPSINRRDMPLVPARHADIHHSHSPAGIAGSTYLVCLACKADDHRLTEPCPGPPLKGLGLPRAPRSQDYSPVDRHPMTDARCHHPGPGTHDDPLEIGHLPEPALERMKAEGFIELKSWSQFFQAIKDGRKKHDLRDTKDRAFKVGGLLLLREFDQFTGVYTGEMLVVEITFITSREVPCAFSCAVLHRDYAILSLGLLT